MQKYFLAAALAIFGTGLASAQNLIVNGSFEADAIPATQYNYTYTNKPASFTPYAYEATAWQGINLTGWNVTSNGRGLVLFNSSYQPIAQGLKAIQFETTNDRISQSFATVAGQEYRLSYAVSGNENVASSLDVFLDGTTVDSASTSSKFFATHSYNFFGTGQSMNLEFSSLGKYPQLDNISVTAVPEPESYAMLLAGLGVLGFFGRRRKV